MFRAIRRVLDEHPDCKAVYPIHMNPVVRKAADEELGDCDRIHIIEPIEVFDCHNFEARCHLCLTDSGGIQEEVPSYGRPVLVMRDTTERPEGVKAGTLRFEVILTLVIEHYRSIVKKFFFPVAEQIRLDVIFNC